MAKDKKLVQLFPKDGEAAEKQGEKRESPVHDEPDAAEHPALREEKAVPRVPKMVYRVAAILLAAVLVLLVALNWSNLTPENIGNWIRTKVVGFGFGDGYPAALVGSTAEAGNFGALEGNVYVLSDTALSVMNSSAKSLFSVRHSYNNPRVSAVNDRFLLYNAGGTGYRVETAAGTQTEGVSDSNITTGVMSGSGKFALAVQASDAASSLRVYLRDGSLQYRYDFADTYITAVALNSDGTRGAVADVTSRSGTLVTRITILDFSSETPVAQYESAGNLVVSLLWTNANRVIAVGDTETLVSDGSFEFTAYDYGGQEVTAYCTTRAHAVVSVSNYAYDGNSTLLVFSDSAEPLQIPLEERAVWLSASGSKVSALHADSVVSCDLLTGTVQAACTVYNDVRSVAMADESTIYTLGVREIRKETLKEIEKEEVLSPSP